MLTKHRAIALLLLSLPAASMAADRVPRRRPTEQKKESYGHHVFAGRGPYLKSAAGAGMSQGTTTPYEWGGGIAGYARRLGSAFGKHAIKSSIQYSIAHWRHEEIQYRLSNKHGFGPRLKYALESTVITHKTTTGERTVATGEIAGAVGSGLISRLWQPASTGTIAAGFGSAGVSMGADAGYHVVREFWPEIRHPHGQRRKAVLESAAR
jgi:hypothetical protein